jgi:transcriptional regulator with XRE-family HTH domain
MILKQLRLSRLLSQEQLAQMSGLSVRTIQRIESGQTPSVESLKCLASALDVDAATLTRSRFEPDRGCGSWQRLPMGLKWLFALNFFSLRPSRGAALRVEFASHLSGFVFCVLGLQSEATLVGGLLMLANAYLFRLHVWLGDAYGAWYDRGVEEAAPGGR